MADRQETESCLHTLLQLEKFRDYGLNGLQVDGLTEVCHVASRVTANEISEPPTHRVAQFGVQHRLIEIENPA